MKKIFVAVAALATMLFVSCNKEANYPSLIQGTWESKTSVVNITKNGKAVTAAEFVAGVTDASMKETLTKMFEAFSTLQDARGITLTFKDGKVTPAGEFPGGEYTVSGNTLTIKADGQTVPFTIANLTNSDLSLTFDPDKVPEYKQETAGMDLQGYAITITLNFTKR
ncbi:MAG: lipocalin family protein [Bacteroidales bacterium]|nr:lipocalin family protein [Bacteroidales bacterium]